MGITRFVSKQGDALLPGQLRTITKAVIGGIVTVTIIPSVALLGTRPRHSANGPESGSHQRQNGSTLRERGIAIGNTRGEMRKLIAAGR